MSLFYYRAIDIQFIWQTFGRILSFAAILLLCLYGHILTMKNGYVLLF